MKKVSYLIISAAVAITLLIFIYLSNKEFSLIVLGFAAWAISPYLYLFILVKYATNKNIKIILGSALVICLFGISLQIETTLIGVNAQGGLALLFIPVYQWAALGLTTVIVFALKMIKNA